MSDEAAVKRTEKLAGGVDAENAAFEARKIQRQCDFDNRKARIARAHAAVRKRVMDEIGELHGQSKYKIQASTLEAERLRDDALANTVVTLENFRQAAAHGAEVLDGLTLAARSAFGGCGKFRRLLSPTAEWPEPDLSPDENKLFEEFQRLQKKIGGDVGQFKKFPLPKIFKFLPIWLLTILLLAVGAAFFVLPRFQREMSFPNRRRESPWARSRLSGRFIFWESRGDAAGENHRRRSGEGAARAGRRRGKGRVALPAGSGADSGRI